MTLSTWIFVALYLLFPVLILLFQGVVALYLFFQGLVAFQLLFPELVAPALALVFIVFLVYRFISWKTKTRCGEPAGKRD